MKRLAALVALMLIAAPAAAQLVVKPICVDANGKAYPFTADGNGNLQASDPARDRDVVYQNLASLSTVLLFGNSDSTQAIPTRGWSHIGVTFYPSFFDSVAGTFAAHPEYVILGLTVIHHYLSALDTVSSFDWLRRNRSGQPAAGAFYADSFGTVISPGMLLPADSLTRRWEIPVVLHLQPIRRGEVAWLDDVTNGAPFQSPFISLVVRNAGVRGFTTGATGPVVLFSGQAGVGIPLSRVQCGIALVGAR